MSYDAEKQVISEMADKAADCLSLASDANDRIRDLNIKLAEEHALRDKADALFKQYENILFSLCLPRTVLVTRNGVLIDNDGVRVLSDIDEYARAMRNEFVTKI